MSFAALEYWPAISGSALLTALLFALYLYLKWRAVNGPVPIIPKGIIRGSRGAAITKNIIIFTAIFLTAFTLLRPRWGEFETERESEGADLLIMLDVSLSMQAEEGEQSRLNRARQAARLIAESGRGHRTALGVFAGEPFLLCPFTSDPGAFLMFLESASSDSVRLQGTDLGAALTMASKLFTKKQMTSKVLVLITDGEDHQGTVDAAADTLAKEGVEVYPLAIGSESGEVIPLGEGEDAEGKFLRDRAGKIVSSKMNSESLKKLAAKTGGVYGDITSNFRAIDAPIDALTGREKTKNRPRRISEAGDRFHIFAAILALLLMIETAIPERRLKP
jgi:Ca-activated chloride channel family protein